MQHLVGIREASPLAIADVAFSPAQADVLTLAHVHLFANDCGIS